MVEGGNTMGAQKIILAELTKETGGSAAAFGKTLPGQIAIAKQMFSNLAGEVVGKVVPALLATVQWVQQNWPKVQAAIKVTVDWIKLNVVPTAVAVLNGIRDAWDRIAPVARAAFTAVVNVIRPALQTIKVAVETVLALIRDDWSKVWQGLKGIATGALETAANAVKGLAHLFLAAGKALGKAIVDGVVDALGGIGSSIRGAIGGALSKIPVVGGALSGIVGHADGGIVTRPELAVIGEAGPEAVIPLDRPQRAQEVMAQAGLSGGGTTVVVETMNVRNSVDVELVAYALSRRMLRPA